MGSVIIAPPERGLEARLKDIVHRLRALERGQRSATTPPSGGGGAIQQVAVVGPVELFARYEPDGVTVKLLARNTATGTEPTVIATLA